MDANRPEYVQAALQSYPGMLSVLTQLTESELYEVLAIEASTARRISLMRRIMGRIVRLRSDQLRQELEEQYNAPHKVKP